MASLFRCFLWAPSQLDVLKHLRPSLGMFHVTFQVVLLIKMYLKTRPLTSCPCSSLVSPPSLCENLVQWLLLFLLPPGVLVRLRASGGGQRSRICHRGREGQNFLFQSALLPAVLTDVKKEIKSSYKNMHVWMIYVMLRTCTQSSSWNW